MNNYSSIKRNNIMHTKYILLFAVLMFFNVPGSVLFSRVIKTEQKIVIGACEWEPYTGENMPGKGLLSQISIEALKRAGYESEVIIYPWARAFEESKNGNIHALLGAGYSKERTAYFVYPDAIWTANVGFFTSSENNLNRKFSTIANLAPATVGVLNGSNYIEILDKVQGIKVEKAARVEFNIKKVAYRRIDYLIEDKAAVEFFIKKEVPELKGKVVFLNPPYKKEKIFLVFSRQEPNHKKLVHDFNSGLSRLKKEGSYNRIVSSFGLDH